MKFNLKPADIKTVRLLLKKRGGSARHASITIPQDIVRRYNLNDKEEIVIGYICKAGEDLEDCE